MYHIEWIHKRKETTPSPHPIFFFLQKFDVAVLYEQELLNGRTKALRCMKFTYISWLFNAFLSVCSVVNQSSSSYYNCRPRRIRRTVRPSVLLCGGLWSSLCMFLFLFNLFTFWTFSWLIFCIIYIYMLMNVFAWNWFCAISLFYLWY